MKFWVSDVAFEWVSTQQASPYLKTADRDRDIQQQHDFLPSKIGNPCIVSQIRQCLSLLLMSTQSFCIQASSIAQLLFYRGDL